MKLQRQIMRLDISFLKPASASILLRQKFGAHFQQEIWYKNLLKRHIIRPFIFIQRNIKWQKRHDNVNHKHNFDDLT